MAQQSNQEFRYEYYTSRDWVQTLGRGKQHLLAPDRHPPQDGSWWGHLRALWRTQPGFRVTIPLSKYRLEQNNQRIIICIKAIDEDTWQQYYQSSRDQAVRTTIKSAKSVRSMEWANSYLFLLTLMIIGLLVFGYIRFELLG